MKSALVVVIAVLITGCATPGTSEQRSLQSEWDSSSARRIFEVGANSLKGNAFMRQKGGGVVTCAGQTVTLIPVTSYAIERMNVLYGGGESGFHRGRNIQFNPNPSEYYTMTKTTKCDSQGNFVYEAIADGEYYVTLKVQWYVDHSPQGGNLMQRVRLTGGKQVNVIMSA